MPRRVASPALSENEVDIGGALFTEDLDDSLKLDRTAEQDGFGFDADGIFNAGDGSDDDDEAFIALQQAASFRKASNLKGKSVKKVEGSRLWVRKIKLSYPSSSSFDDFQCVACVHLTLLMSRSQRKYTASDCEERLYSTHSDSA